MEQFNRIELRGKDGTPIIETTWHNINAWEGKDIRDLDKIEKGTKLYVQGRIRNVRFVGQDGLDHFSTDVQAHRIVIIDGNEPLQYEM